MKGGMKKKNMVEASSIFLLFCSVFFSVNVVYAAEQAQEEAPAQAMSSEEMKEKGIPKGGLQISPTKFVWTLNEGEIKTGRVIVKNYSDQEQLVTLDVEDFYVRDDGKTPQVYVPDEDHELKALDVREWITPPNSFRIPAGGAEAVEFTVRVPDGQPTNGYYGTLLFRTGGDGDETEGSKIGLNYRIGTLLIMAVQGDAPMDMRGEIVDFYPEKTIFFETPAAFYVKTQNTGNMHFPLFGSITVNRFGKKFHAIELTPRLIYPQKTVDFREVMQFGMWDFGKFDARVAMHSEDNVVQMEKTTSFWVIPWKGLLVIMGGLCGLMIAAKIFRRYVHIGIGDKKKHTKKTDAQKKEKSKKSA